MTTYTQNGGRAVFGSLNAALSPQERALEAIGETVPQLEAALGFALSVQAQVKIWVRVLLPDEYYNGRNSEDIGRQLWEAARPFTQFVHIETDSNAPYEQ